MSGGGGAGARTCGPGRWEGPGEGRARDAPRGGPRTGPSGGRPRPVPAPPRPALTGRGRGGSAAERWRGAAGPRRGAEPRALPAPGRRRDPAEVRAAAERMPGAGGAPGKLSAARNSRVWVPPAAGCR